MAFYLLVALIFALLLVVEGSVLSFFIMERALPDLYLVLVVCLGFMLGERRGALIGLLAGLLQDIVLGSALGFFACAKMLLGYGAGLLGRELYHDQLLAPSLMVLVGTLIHEFLLFFLITRFIGPEMSVEWSISNFFIPKAFYNMGLTLLCYPLLYRFYHSSLYTRNKDKAAGKEF